MRKFVLGALLSLLLSAQALAAPVFVWQRNVADTTGLVVASASVAVRDSVTSNLAQLYSDVDGLSGMSNPTTADSSGFVRFYVAEGRYNITATSGGFSRTWSNERLGVDASELKQERTAAEIAAGVTPTAYQYDPGDVRRYGADGSDSNSDKTAINAALSINAPVYLPPGTYYAQGLTQSHDFQTVYGIGSARVQKNANGTLLTSSGDNVEFNNVQFRGGTAGADFTGDGVTASGDNLRMINSGVRFISGVPLTATGNHVQIDGTNDIYQTTDTSGTGYDIVIGVSGTATLYHAISNIYTSQATGGIHLIDTGSPAVVGSQFGKLWVDAGTTPSGTNGGDYTNNRILGAVEVELASATFAANAFGAINIHFVSGTSGHRLDESNVLQVGATLDDDSNNSYVIDTRIMSELGEQAYTLTWTAAGTAPAIGNGTLTGFYVKQGRRVFFYAQLLTGTTTTYGTSNYTFALPYAPIVKQTAACILTESGVNTEGGIAVLASGAATFQVFPSEAPSNAVGQFVPFTWAGAGDELTCSGEYYTDTP